VSTPFRLLTYLNCVLTKQNPISPGQGSSITVRSIAKVSFSRLHFHARRLPVSRILHVRRARRVRVVLWMMGAAMQPQNSWDKFRGGIRLSGLCLGECTGQTVLSGELDRPQLGPGHPRDQDSNSSCTTMSSVIPVAYLLPTGQVLLVTASVAPGRENPTAWEAGSGRHPGRADRLRWFRYPGR
jgi:hypothetical protein